MYQDPQKDEMRMTIKKLSSVICHKRKARAAASN